MSTFLLAFAAFVLLIMLLDYLPGVRHLVQPIVGAFTWIFAVFFGSMAAWSFFAVKSLFRAHLTLLHHLVTPRNRMDPVSEIQDENED